MEILKPEISQYGVKFFMDERGIFRPKIHNIKSYEFLSEVKEIQMKENSNGFLAKMPAEILFNISSFMKEKYIKVIYFGKKYPSYETFKLYYTNNLKEVCQFLGRRFFFPPHKYHVICAPDTKIISPYKNKGSYFIEDQTTCIIWENENFYRRNCYCPINNSKKCKCGKREFDWHSVIKQL